MKEEFHQSENLSIELLRELSKKCSLPSLKRFALQYLVLIASLLTLLFGESGSFVCFLAISVFGFSSMAMFAVGHETIHKTAFVSPLLNDLVCFLACFPVFHTPTGFRYFHFAHHHFTHNLNKDPEISVMGKQTPGLLSSLWIYISYLSGMPLMLAKMSITLAGAIGAGGLTKKYLWYVPADKWARLRWESCLVIAAQALLVTLFISYDRLSVLMIAQIVGHSMLSLYIFAEHNLLPNEGTILERTRTMRYGPFINNLMWNMPYHAEHHAFPSVAWHALPRLHKAMNHELVNQEFSLFHVHSQALKQIKRASRSA